MSGIVTLTQPVQLCFPKIIVPSTSSSFKRDDGQPSQPRYDCTLRFALDHPDLGRISAEMQAVAAERWGANPSAFPTPFSWALRDGNREDQLARQDGGKGKEWAKGYWILPLKAYPPRAPRLGAVDGNGTIHDFPGEGDARLDARKFFYGGAFVIAEFNFGTYPKKGQRAGTTGYGVTAYINRLFSYGGERVSEIEGRGDAPASELYNPAHVGRPTNASPLAGLPV